MNAEEQIVWLPGNFDKGQYVERLAGCLGGWEFDVAIPLVEVASWLLR